MRYPNAVDALGDPAALRVVYRETAPAAAVDARWERGPVLQLSPESDWSDVATLADLWPSTEYEWTVTWVANHTRPYNERVQRFVTFPDPMLPKAVPSSETVLGGPFFGPAEGAADVPNDDPHHFRFATSSCVKPDFPWHPAQFIGWSWLTGAARNRIARFDLLAQRHDSGRPLRFFLQLGDLIYADVPV